MAPPLGGSRRLQRAPLAPEAPGSVNYEVLGATKEVLGSIDWLLTRFPRISYDLLGFVTFDKDFLGF